MLEEAQYVEEGNVTGQVSYSKVRHTWLQKTCPAALKDQRIEIKEIAAARKQERKIPKNRQPEREP